ncbi:MerR family transcriptional regulator [Anaerocolumna xylanovorans]|uniref:DNA-binding transcriptional regulator, MerR family n=1 Tax=Anaerocolumna xylanovorans DSM 12503 TaxID=1121345 RepID=A0A1M7Y7X3_9FIRM|nr:methyltransferase domain-containing protein [Anaerocolumna xylanovorans]SHO48710.1 DNA-binding transcriptional regulator, MerR family [Anaerocolumna xylanovorans DSM 12503]
MEDKLFTAGEIADLSGVSVRTIRYYDKRKILKPIHYSENGYRLYNQKSVETLQKIVMLKYVGFSLEQIESMIREDKDLDLKKSLAAQKALLYEKRDHMERIIRAVEKAENASEQDAWECLVNVIQVSTEKEKLEKQYHNDENLQKRINIHNYSTAKIPWMDWIYERLNIESGMKVLELGCGNGLFWKENIEQLPDNIEILLTDYSEGMLEKARKTMECYGETLKKRNIQIRFMQMDANDLQIKGEKFDLIIANHMLYHIDNREELFRNIRNILTETGRFCCSTVGITHMQELNNFIVKFDRSIEMPFQWITNKFRLENGKEQLETVFSNVELEIQDNDLRVDNVDVIYSYAYSYPGNAADILKKREKEFKKAIAKIIKDKGTMYIHKSQGIFMCKL